jgi:hypothetical protein
MTTPAPAEGTLGFGVGKLTPAHLLRPDEDPFHSIVWFPADCEAEASEFAAQFGYEVREGVAL